MEKPCAMEEKITGSGSEIERMNLDVDAFFKEIEGKEEEYASKINALEEALAESKEKEEKLRLDFEERCSELIASYEKILGDLNKKEKEFWSQSQALKQEEALKNNQIEELKEKTKSMVMELERMAEFLAEEKKRNIEKEVLVQSSKSALKGREAEIEKLWRMIEESGVETGTYKLKINDKENELERARSKILEYESEIRKLNEALARTEEGFKNKIEILQRELQEKEKNFSNLNLKLKSSEDKAEQEAQKFTEELAALRSETERGISENAFSEALKEAKLKEEELSLQLSEKSNEAISLKTRLEALQKELEDMAEKWKFSSAQLQNTASNLRSRNIEIEVLNGKIKSLEAECEHYRQISLKTQDIAAALKDYDGKIESEKISALTESLKHESEKYAGLLLRYNDLSSGKRDIEADNTSLKLELESAKKEIRRLVDKHNSYIQAKEGEIRALEERINAAGYDFSGKLREALEKERQKYQKLANETREISLMLKEKETELEEANGSLESLRTEHEKLKKHEKEIRDKYAEEILRENLMLEEAKRNIGFKETEMSRLRNNIGSLEMEVKKLHADSKILKEERDRMSARAKARKDSNLLEKEKVIKEMENILKKKEHEIQETRKKVEHLGVEKEEWIKKEKRLKESFETRPYKTLLKEAEKRLADKEKEIFSLKIRLNDLAKEHKNLAGRRNGLKSSGRLAQPQDLHEIVAGISHQISNSISIIRSHAEYCMEAREHSELKEPMEAIVRSIVGLQKKIEEMSNFARPLALHLKDATLNDLINDVAASLKKEIDLKNVKITIKREKELKPVKMDYVRLHEAFRQIILNAIEAAPSQGGGIKLETAMDQASNTQIVTIDDSGSGIETKHLSNIFQPFFTTKQGKMGLGLSLAKNIIKAHAGDIKVKSEFGKGVVVEITLPETKN